MMITATGNNFGAGAILLKDYQSERMVILNGRVEIDPTDAAYQAAQQLEIYVPDLMLHKSTWTAVYLHGKWNNKPFVSAVKSRIKDKNTIIVEKPPLFNSATACPELDFLCAYVPKGVRFEIEALRSVTLTLEEATIGNMSIAYQQCFITENWVYLAIRVSGIQAEQEGDAFSFKLTGLPAELNSEVPFFFNSYTINISGSFEVPMSVAGSQFFCEGLTGLNYSEGGLADTLVFLVR